MYFFCKVFDLSILWYFRHFFFLWLHTGCLILFVNSHVFGGILLLPLLRLLNVVFSGHLLVSSRGGKLLHLHDDHVSAKLLNTLYVSRKITIVTHICKYCIMHKCIFPLLLYVTFLLLWWNMVTKAAYKRNKLLWPVVPEGKSPSLMRKLNSKQQAWHQELGAKSSHFQAQEWGREGGELETAWES